MFPSHWDKRFMLLAHHIGTWSKERGRRFGAVIVGPDREVRAMGYNGIPRGVDDDIEERHSHDGGAKYLWAAHAEANAVFNAARVGVSVKGCVIYVPLFPCADCAKAIIQSGIVELVTYDQPERANDDVWAASFAVSEKMLAEGGVKIRTIPKLAEMPIGREQDAQ